MMSLEIGSFFDIVCHLGEQSDDISRRIREFPDCGHGGPADRIFTHSSTHVFGDDRDGKDRMMDVSVFSTRPYDRRFLTAANAAGAHRLNFLEARLTVDTAKLAAGSQAVCVFVNDLLDADILRMLADIGVRLVALRCAGFNRVDLREAARLGIHVVRVPAYSPHAVAEHAMALMLSLIRNIHRAYNRVREGNFTLDGLLGFDLSGKSVGIVGTGKIGTVMARILTGFGCRVLAFNPVRNAKCLQMGVEYADFDEMVSAADIITLHCPLTPQTRHLIGAGSISRMKPGVVLINTSRGAVIDTRAVIAGLKSGHFGGIGLDVYEEEGDLFFEDLSEHPIQDDVFARLLTFPNVLITGHQGFFTVEALGAIAATTISNIATFENTGKLVNEVTLDMLYPAADAS